MSELEAAVAAHYAVTDLMALIRDGLRQAGADPDAPAPEDLKPVDEFHTGGLQATEDLLNQVAITPDLRVLDIGSGLGGTARFIATTRGARVTGVDLTETYVAVAKELSALVGLSERTEFLCASALDLPLADASVDVATMFHVGMNIPDKDRLMTEVARVLAPGGTFALFDIMAMSDDPPDYPMPWAERPELSSLASPARYLAAADAAGLVPVAQRDRGAFALTFFSNVARVIEEKGMPPLGIHLLMRGTAGQKIKNYVAGVSAGRVAPQEMIFRKAG